MKKTSKMLGAIALSAAMALGTAVPAFAADTEAGSTQVDVLGIASSASQISVTVPTQLTFSVESNGGTLIAPSGSAYAIENNSPSATVKVKSVTPTLAEGWELTTDTLTSSNQKSTNSKLQLNIKTDMSSDIQISGTSAITLTDGYYNIVAGDKLELTLSGSALPSSTINNSNGFSTTESVPAVKLSYTVEATS